MYWRNLTTREFEKIDKTTPVILPIAAIEQHGSHLTTATDTAINEMFCSLLDREVGDDVLILPTVAVACSAHHLDFPGTLTVRHETFLKYLEEILESVLHNDFRRLLVFNSHGGNQAVGQVLVESFGIKHPEAKIAVFTWWKIALEKLSALNESGFLGVGHAGEFETSLMYWWDEGQVREKAIEKGKINNAPDWSQGDLLRAPRVSLHHTMKELTENGVYGNPVFASKEKGEKIARVVMEEMKKIVLDFKKI